MNDAAFLAEIVADVPEPASWAGLALGTILAGTIHAARRRSA